MPPQDLESAQWYDEKVRPHHSALRAWLRARFPSLADPDDILQDCYLRLLRTRSDQPVINPKAFLYTSVRNAALDMVRRNRVVTIEPIVNAEPSFVEEQRPGTPETVSSGEEMDILLEAIQALPERCREIMTLQKIHGVPNRQIAERLGISINTVNAQLVNGLMKCRAFLRARGVVRGPQA